MSAHADALDARLMRKRGECMEAQQGHAAASQRASELQAALGARDAECVQLQRLGAEAKAQLHKALENLTATQVMHSKQVGAGAEGVQGQGRNNVGKRQRKEYQWGLMCPLVCCIQMTCARTLVLSAAHSKLAAVTASLTQNAPKLPEVSAPDVRA